MKHDIIPGEIKIVEVLVNFDYHGRKYSQGDTFEASGHEAWELFNVRRPRKSNLEEYTAMEAMHINAPPIRVISGGMFSLSRRNDGFHEIELWLSIGKPEGYSTSDKIICSTFLRDCPGLLAQAGDKRRLRLSVAREMAHRYRNWQTLPPGVSYAIRPDPPMIQIEEDRPRQQSHSDLLANSMAEQQYMARKEFRWDVYGND
jgi:hypothetical protein